MLKIIRDTFKMLAYNIYEDPVGVALNVRDGIPVDTENSDSITGLCDMVEFLRGCLDHMGASVYSMVFITTIPLDTVVGVLRNGDLVVNKEGDLTVSTVEGYTRTVS